MPSCRAPGLMGTTCLMTPERLPAVGHQKPLVLICTQRSACLLRPLQLTALSVTWSHVGQDTGRWAESRIGQPGTRRTPPWPERWCERWRTHKDDQLFPSCLEGGQTQESREEKRKTMYIHREPSLGARHVHISRPVLSATMVPSFVSQGN